MPLMEEFATQLRLRPRGIRDGVWITWRQLMGRPLLGPSCPRCGYPAQGLARPQCPECGCDLAKSGLIDSRVNPRLAWGAIWLAVSVAAAGALVTWATPALQRRFVPKEVRDGAVTGLGFSLASAPGRTVRLYARTPPFRMYAGTAIPEQIALLELSTDLSQSKSPALDSPFLIINPTTMLCTSEVEARGGASAIHEPPPPASWHPFDRQAVADWLASARVRTDTPAAQAEIDAIDQLVVQGRGLRFSTFVPTLQKHPITGVHPRSWTNYSYGSTSPRRATRFRAYVNGAWLALWLAGVGWLGWWVRGGRLGR